jgi:hypothetical protein
LLTPILFFLLLMVVFYTWVNVMVAIISEVYQEENKAYGTLEVDEDYECMMPSIPHPQNDQQAMLPHYPVHSSENDDRVDPVALTPDRCVRTLELCQVSCWILSNAVKTAVLGN